MADKELFEDAQPNKERSEPISPNGLDTEAGDKSKMKGKGKSAGKPFSLKKWNAVAMWRWDVECDTCAICRVQVQGVCALYSRLATFSVEKIHIFHKRALQWMVHFCRTARHVLRASLAV